MQLRMPSADLASEASATVAAATRLSFVAVYTRWFDHACRWLPAMGVPDADIEDVVQELFIVARGKLDKFAGDNVGGWLYAIALRLAANHRRKAWLRRFFFRADDAAILRAHDGAASPLERLEANEKRALLDAMLARMSEKRRRALALYEIQGYSGEEIAALEGVPLKTVWTRLHHARRDLVALAAEHRRSL
jgi:RNA polymerase sigma-70 factor (ECF subfamily)